MFKKLRFSKKASIEIGINTIVIMVIAIVLLGLGVAFVKGIFAKMNKLPGAIDIPSVGKEPNAAEPVVMGQSEVSIKSGEIAQVPVGIYNTGAKGDFKPAIETCTDGATPTSSSLKQTINQGESAGFLMNIDTSDTTGVVAGTYICTLQAFKVSTSSSDPVASTQFTLVITS